MPRRLASKGSKLAFSFALSVGQLLTIDAESMIPNAISIVTAASSAYPVERSERSLVHSERTIRA